MSERGGTARGWVGASVGAGGVAVALAALVPWLAVGGAGRGAVASAALLLGPLSSGAGAFAAARVASDGRVRRAWMYVALASAAAAFGQAAWAFREVVRGEAVPFPSEAFGGFVAFHLFFAAALIVVLRPARDPRFALEIAFDGVLVLLVVVALGLRFVLEPPLVQGWITLEQASAVMIGQVATAGSTLFALLLLVWRDTELPAAVVRALAFAAGLFLVLNVAIALGADPRPDRAGDAFDLLWLAGWLALAWAGCRAATRPGAPAWIRRRDGIARRIRQAIVPAVTLLFAAGAIDAARRPYFTRGSAVVFAAVGVMIAVRAVNALAATEREAERRRRAEAAAYRAHLRTVVSRLRPHFVLNALSAIGELVRRGAPTAEASVVRLGGVLRHALSHGAERIELRRELRVTVDYLHLERLRYGDRLRTRIAVDPDALSVRVPPFVLQPLVENAVRHGVARKPEGGCVRVRAGLRDGALILDVADDGAGADRARLRDPAGLGLRGVRAQLRSHYGRAARLRIRTAPGRGFAARIVIPATTTQGATWPSPP